MSATPMRVVNDQAVMTIINTMRGMTSALRLLGISSGELSQQAKGT